MVYLVYLRYGILRYAIVTQRAWQHRYDGFLRGLGFLLRWRWMCPWMLRLVWLVNRYRRFEGSLWLNIQRQEVLGSLVTSFIYLSGVTSKPTRKKKHTHTHKHLRYIDMFRVHVFMTLYKHESRQSIKLYEMNQKMLITIFCVMGNKICWVVCFSCCICREFRQNNPTFMKKTAVAHL